MIKRITHNPTLDNSSGNLRSMRYHRLNRSISRDRTYNSWHILLIALLFLVIAHLTVKTYFPIPVYWIASAGFIVIIGTFLLIGSKDDFGFLLTMFICVHFGFADNQGGLWIYIILGIFILSILLGYRPMTKLSSVPFSTNVFIFAFLIFQLIGTGFNTYSVMSNIQATVIVVAQLIIFYYCASLPMTKMRVKRLLTIWSVTACWVFVMGLNQRYQMFIFKSPLLPQRTYQASGMGFIKMTSSPAASFGNSELLAEYFCIILLISLIIFIQSIVKNNLRIRMGFPFFMFLLSIAGLFMSNSRAAMILAVIGAFLILAVTFILTPSIRNVEGFFIIFLVFSFIVTPLIVYYGNFFFLNVMIADFNKVDISVVSVEGIISGQDINRGAVFEPALQQLREKSFWIGKGYSVTANNRVTLGIQGIKLADFHSLYLSLPFFYGWIGAIAYCLFILGTGLRVFGCYLRIKKSYHYLVPITLAFTMLWFVFLLDQYKISITRNPNYFLLTWFWLGWTHSIVNTIESKLPNSGIQNSIAHHVSHKGNR
ncbi:MAG: O-antigen ligase family protein [Calditrichaeota bacterium]|nr:O-antigen ligase family protein [Calditrichota bacterium]